MSCDPGLPVQVSDASGKLETKEVGSGTLKREMLNSEEVYIMDNGAEIFVWIGKKASDDEKKSGMKLGTQYCAESGRPANTRVSKARETPALALVPR